MSARVVKAQNAEKAFPPGRLQAFSLYEMGEQVLRHEGVGAFVFPSLADLNVPPAHLPHAAVPFTAEDDIDAARGEASRIIARAEADRETIERAAYEKGLAEARATVEAEIAERSAAEIGMMRDQLASTISEISRLSAGMTQRAGSEVVRLALAIAKKIVHREAAADHEIVLNTAKAALSRLHSRSTVEIRLHPDDHEHVRLHQEKLGYRGSLELVADASIAPGGCLVHTDAGDIDATIDSQLEEIAEVLLAPSTEEEIAEAEEV